MSKDLNKVQLIGRLGADPEMRYTSQGNAVTTFRVASSRTWKKADGQLEEETEWFRVVAWNRLGEVCGEYLRKGSRVYVEGRLKTRSWQDQDGQTRYMTEVVAEDMIMLDSRRDAQGSDYGDNDIPYDVEPEPEPVAARPAPASNRFGNEAAAPARRAPVNSGSNVPQRQPARPAPANDRPRRPAAPANDPMDDEDLPF
jgi:single-strand DNA-binding protein